MIRIPIKRNQIWKNKVSGFQLMVSSKKGVKWKCKVLTDKHDVYNGTHTMSQFTIWKKFELVK